MNVEKSKSKRTHIVQQAYLKNFSRKTKKGVFLYRFGKKTQKIQYLDVKNVAVEKYFYPDSRHLALACYIINNRRSETHDYIFYTDDNQYIASNLEKVVNVPNLKIKKIIYNTSTKLEYSVLTKSFSIRRDILEFVQDEDLV